MSNTKQSIALIFHCGYWNMWNDFIPLIHRFCSLSSKYNIDFYLTHQMNNEDIVNSIVDEQITRIFPSISVFIFKTMKGVDTGALIYVLQEMEQRNKSYVAAFKVHTKGNKDWREDLLENISNTTQEMERCIDILLNYPSIGTICSKEAVNYRSCYPNQSLSRLVQEMPSMKRDANIFNLDYEFYESYHPELIRLNDIEVLRKHWNVSGRKERDTIRQNSPTEFNLDPLFYLNQYNDLRIKLGNNRLMLMRHWQNYGKREGRFCSQQMKDLYESYNKSMVSLGKNAITVQDWWIYGRKPQLANSFDRFSESYKELLRYGITKAMLENEWKFKLCANNDRLTFVAGTIFWFKPSILLNWFKENNVNLKQLYEKCDFGHERSRFRQESMAHYLERLFGMIMLLSGYMIISMSDDIKSKYRDLVRLKQLDFRI